MSNRTGIHMLSYQYRFASMTPFYYVDFNSITKNIHERSLELIVTFHWGAKAKGTVKECGHNDFYFLKAQKGDLTQCNNIQEALKYFRKHYALPSYCYFLCFCLPYASWNKKYYFFTPSCMPN